MAFSFRGIASALCLTLCLPLTLVAQQSHQSFAKVKFRCAESSPAKGLIEASVRHTNEKIYLHQESPITIRDILEARVVKSYDSNSYEIEMDVTKEGAKKISRITRNCVAKKLAILIDDEVVSAPIVNEHLHDKARVFGATTKDEAEKIADAINWCRKRTGPSRWSVQSRAKVGLGRVAIELRAAEREPAKGLIEATVRDTGERIFLHKYPIITNRDIIEARVLRSYYGDFFEVEATLNEDGAARMTKLSREHRGKPLAIIVGGKVVSVPIVISEIRDKVKINGAFTRDEAERIAKSLSKK